MVYLTIYLFFLTLFISVVIFAAMPNEFMSALQKARLELTQVEGEQRRLAQRKAQLLQTIAALASLVTEQPTHESLSLADAIRTVITGAAINKPQTVFTPKMVRTLLQEMGFDFSEYNENHLAAIHTAMRRMQKAGELEPAGDVDFGGGYRRVVTTKLPPDHPLHRLKLKSEPGKR